MGTHSAFLATHNPLIPQEIMAIAQLQTSKGAFSRLPCELLSIIGIPEVELGNAMLPHRVMGGIMSAYGRQPFPWLFARRNWLGVFVGGCEPIRFWIVWRHLPVQNGCSIGFQLFLTFNCPKRTILLLW